MTNRDLLSLSCNHSHFASQIPVQVLADKVHEEQRSATMRIERASEIELQAQRTREVLHKGSGGSAAEEIEEAAAIKEAEAKEDALRQDEERERLEVRKQEAHRKVLLGREESAEEKIQRQKEHNAVHTSASGAHSEAESEFEALSDAHAKEEAHEEAMSKMRAMVKRHEAERVALLKKEELAEGKVQQSRDLGLARHAHVGSRSEANAEESAFAEAQKREDALERSTERLRAADIQQGKLRAATLAREEKKEAGSKRTAEQHAEHTPFSPQRLELARALEDAKREEKDFHRELKEVHEDDVHSHQMLTLEEEKSRKRVAAHILLVKVGLTGARGVPPRPVRTRGAALVTCLYAGSVGTASLWVTECLLKMCAFAIRLRMLTSLHVWRFVPQFKRPCFTAKCFVLKARTCVLLLTRCCNAEARGSRAIGGQGTDDPPCTGKQE